MAFGTFWKRLSAKQLAIFIQAFSLIAIFFEGYDQGVMGGVNASPNFVTEVGIGLPNGVVTDTTHQGGIVDNGNSAVRWRFLLAFQCFPALLLMAAKEVLDHIRGRKGLDVDKEFLEICTVAEDSKPSSPIQFAKVLLGRATNGAHLGRRAWLCLWLKIMASWTGITAVTAYSPVLLKQAGYSSIKQNGLAGGLNTIGIGGTIISARILDRYARRKCLIWGACGLFLVNLIAASLYEGSIADPSKAAQIAPAAVTMLFLFNLIYAATWGTVAFLIPTEIFPSEMRAQGNGFGITGWAIGVGWTVLVNPIMFAHLESRTYLLFAGLNLLWMPIVFFFYPETAHRSLESIEAMFSPSSPFYAKMEAAYRAAGNGDVLAARRLSLANPSENAERFAIQEKVAEDGSMTHSE